ncbi:unnamed protein product, partial [Aphanomyces euteiches]
MCRTLGIRTINNADQTAVNYEYLPRGTVDTTNAKTVWVKCAGKDKERATTIRCAEDEAYQDCPRKGATGLRTLVWKEVQACEEIDPVRVYGNKTAWWNSSLSVEFLEFHFGSRPSMENEKIMLLWDDFACHFTPEIQDCAYRLNIVLEKIPPSYTLACQPSD